MSKKDLQQLDTCQVAGCGKERREHTAGEKAETINHEFSKDGRLIVLDRRRPPGKERGNSQRSSGLVRPMAGGDPILRYLLINKGIITTDELDEAEKMLKTIGALGPTPAMRLGRVDDAAPDA